MPHIKFAQIIPLLLPRLRPCFAYPPARSRFRTPFRSCPSPSPIQQHQVLSCFSHFVFLPTLYFFIYAKCIEKINKIINESRTRLVWFFLTFLFIFCYFVILLLCIPLWFRFRPSKAIPPSQPPGGNQPPNNENRKTQKYKTDAQPATMD